MRTSLILLIAVSACADSASTGAGNSAAMQLSRSVPRVEAGMKELVIRAGEIRDPKLKRATLDLLTNAKACIAHRVGLTEADERQIVGRLHESGLLEDASAIAGVFPPADGDRACPHFPQSFQSAPGSVFGGHHSYPGGLMTHELFNLTNARSLAESYRHVYGSDLAPRMDLLIAAPIWHDSAKILVFQWNSDGSEFKELAFGGNGKTDNFGAPGDSRTGAHHILGVAEAMSRKFAPEQVITQACAHSFPTGNGEFKVVNWIRAAAIIARVDPVQRGYLIEDSSGRLRLPSILPEYLIHNLSDADYEFTNSSITFIEALLEQLAPEFGYSRSDATRYNLKYRNVALAHLTAERLMFLYSRSGLPAVRSELQILKQSGKI